jgi:hypothetical protein
VLLKFVLVHLLINKFPPAYSNSSISLFENDLVCNYVPSSVICDHSVEFVSGNNSELVINNVIEGADLSVNRDNTIANVTGYCSEFISYQDILQCIKIFDLDTHCYYDRAFRVFFNAFIKCDSHIYNIYRDLGLLCNVQRLHSANYQSFLMYNYFKCNLSGLF